MASPTRVLKSSKPMPMPTPTPPTAPLRGGSAPTAGVGRRWSCDGRYCLGSVRQVRRQRNGIASGDAHRVEGCACGFAEAREEVEVQNAEGLATAWRLARRERLHPAGGGTRHLRLFSQCMPAGESPEAFAPLPMLSTATTWQLWGAIAHRASQARVLMTAQRRAAGRCPSHGGSCPAPSAHWAPAAWSGTCRHLRWRPPPLATPRRAAPPSPPRGGAGSTPRATAAECDLPPARRCRHARRDRPPAASPQEQRA
eukprot:scaffold3440_cov135-Isochrysis_galbana.AAC.2